MSETIPASFNIEDNLANLFASKLKARFDFPNVYTAGEYVEMATERLEVLVNLGRGLREATLDHDKDERFWKVREVRVEFRCVTRRYQDPKDILTGRKLLNDMVAAIDYAMQSYAKLISYEDLQYYRIISPITPLGVESDLDPERAEDSRTYGVEFQLEMLREPLLEALGR